MPKGAIKARVFPKLVKGEDIATGPGAFRNDVEGRVLGTPEHPVAAIDKWIQFLWGEIIDPAEIGDHAMPDFPAT